MFRIKSDYKNKIVSCLYKNSTDRKKYDIDTTILSNVYYILYVLNY